MAPIAVPLLAIAPTASAGTGTWRDVGGVKILDFCVSVQFNATAGQLNDIRDVFTRASDVLADATDGQVRFGDIAIFENSQAGSEAEVKIFSGSGKAVATMGEYSIRASSITSYFTSNYNSSNALDVESNAYTIAHEFMHHLWCLKDEYAGATCAQVGAGMCGFPVGCDANSQGECEPLPGSSTAEYCLLDNYYLRGGNLNNPAQDDFTLNELCVATNHDPDDDTGQTCVNGASCWEVVASHPTRALIAPLGLPVSNPPAIPAPDFVSLAALSRYVLCVDRSGSMNTADAGFGESRLDRAMQAAEIFTNLTEDGDELGVTSFSCSAKTEYGLEVVDAGAKIDANAEIYDLTPGGDTSIGQGLIESRDLILTGAAACNQPIVLFTDGFQNCGPSEASVIDSLIENGIPVTTVAIGSAPQLDLLQSLSQQTGGQSHWVESAENLPALSPFLYAAVSGKSVIGVAEGDVPAVQTLFTTSPVEVGTKDVTFVLSWTNPTADFNLAVVAPGGAFFDASAAAGDPNVDFFAGAGHEILRLRGAAVVPGNWQTLGFPVSGGATSYQMVAIADRADVSLSASTDRPTYAPGDSITVRATPRYDGRAVAPALVTATVSRPNGTIVLLNLFDDGSALDGDVAPGDGTYTARLNLQKMPGTYRFRVKAESLGGSLTVGGESLFDTVGDPDAILPVPPFERHAEVSAVVGSYVCGFSTYGETVPSTHSLLLGGSGGTAIGTPLVATTTGAASGIAATRLSLAPANVPFLGGVLLVSKPVKTRLFPAYAGFAQWQVKIPNDSDLIGLALYFQSYAQSAVHPLGWGFSNGLRLVICPGPN
jgi:hypothetical protein